MKYTYNNNNELFEFVAIMISCNGLTVAFNIFNSDNNMRFHKNAIPLAWMVLEQLVEEFECRQLSQVSSPKRRQVSFLR